MPKEYRYHKGKRYKFTGSFFAGDPIYGRKGERILVAKETNKIVVHYQLSDYPASIPEKS